MDTDFHTYITIIIDSPAFQQLYDCIRLIQVDIMTGILDNDMFAFFTR
ncbi:hypothetical protein [Siminovitchia fortis]|nr:hypothetical protein [Siminovitchia fortis]